ncbi:MAG: nucleoside triphosphate pyrophosphohydrolase [Spirochaetaceae bacterium]|nr:nucleoside triphosphate pyrophosphohydrolase [Spirochaetaceae bacterium]
MNNNAIESFGRFFDIVKRLRAPDGCPWDLEQTPSSLRGSLIEETYECIEAIDEGDAEHIREELGDVFLLACMISYMYEQAGSFSVSGVLDTLSEKLVRRHPHVFGGDKARDSDEVLRNWARIKVEQEGRKPKDSVLDEVSGSLPPLERAFKLQKKAAKCGFDWTDAEEVFAKLDEEIDEVRAALAADRADTNGGGPNSEGADSGELEQELGDLLFSAVNLCRFLKVDPSTALHRANIKFTRRFKYVETGMKKAGRRMTAEDGGGEIMENLWNEAKREEASAKSVD